MKRYKHPEHGYHMAYHSEEIKKLMKAGWVLDEDYGKPEEVKKRGRKPKNDDHNVQ